jgi:two-component system sensor histidine kinase KdpD
MKQERQRQSNDLLRSSTRQLRVAAEIAGLLVAAVFVGYALQRLHHANLSALFLLVVLIIAARHGLWPSIVTSALGFLAFNFFFTVPYRTFLVTEEGDIATLVFFLAIAILGGNLTSRLRSAIRRRDQALERISNLYEFSHRIAGAATKGDILQTLVNHLSATLDAETVIIEQEPGAEPDIRVASHRPLAATDECLESLRAMAREAKPEAQNDGWLFIDISLPDRGDVRLAIHRMDLSREQQELIRNVCGQAKVALDRIQLAEDLDSSRREAERARLRSALLTSVSHDLRTPLASIIGATSTVQELGDSIAVNDRADLLKTVMAEARRLNGYIQNLLDMTRIEHGELRIQRDWEEPSDLVEAAIRRVKESWPDARVTSRVAPDIGLVHLHGELFVQALHNVIDNAVRYSSDAASIDVACWRDTEGLRIEVTDAGPGLDADQRDRIFDMFYRAESGDSHSGGTGLGLSITRGIISAHGGQAFAEAGPNGKGTRVVLLVPDALSGGTADTQ